MYICITELNKPYLHAGSYKHKQHIFMETLMINFDL